MSISGDEGAKTLQAVSHVWDWLVEQGAQRRDALLAFGGWLVSRDRLLPHREATSEEELAGHTVALLALGVASLLVVAVNPFALIFVLHQPLQTGC